jgi:sporulation protein YlmC with PRC-barrel domain
MSRLKDYTVEKGLADPRGWKVVDSAGHVVGEVTDLVVDTDRMAGSYLEVELDTTMFGATDEPRILVPMSRAERDGSQRRVTVPRLTRSRINALYEARAQHEASFWDDWWREGESDAHDASGVRNDGTSPAAERTSRDAELGRTVSDIRPGEAVRIPAGREELVVERRRVSPEEAMTASGADDPPSRHQPDEAPSDRAPLGAFGDRQDLDDPRQELDDPPRRRIDETR